MNINATPTTIVLAGKNYVIHPLTENDNAALDEFVQSQFLKLASLSESDKVIALALEEAINIRWMLPLGRKILLRNGGWARVIFQSLHLPVGTRYFNPCKGATESEMDQMVIAYRRVNDITKGSEAETDSPTVASKEQS